MRKPVRPKWLALTAVAIVALCFQLGVRGDDKPEPQPVSGKIQWVYDYEQGRLMSRETGKPMFVVFRCER